MDHCLRYPESGNSGPRGSLKPCWSLSRLANQFSSQYFIDLLLGLGDLGPGPESP